ncbi:MAG TPA: trehalose-phosphatase [Steroidobacteraceae bacterium]|nr:trehalose-phosphatase [Steroidobacteraceae bacterium]
MTQTGMDTGPPLLPGRAALYLDFDGTLAELAQSPDHVVVNESLPSLLATLAGKLDGALAILTGRRLAAVDALIAPVALAGAGLHGAELRPKPGVTIFRGEPAVAAPLVRRLRERFGDDPRLLVEDKEVAVALHFRRAPARAAECRKAMRAFASPLLFDVIDGSEVVEARPRGADKGAALRALSQLAPFAGRLPVCVGDDRTDEDAIAAAQELSGFGVKVGSHASAARYRLDTVDDVHRWLRSSLACWAQERAQ